MKFIERFRYDINYKSKGRIHLKLVLIIWFSYNFFDSNKYSTDLTIFTISLIFWILSSATFFNFLLSLCSLFSVTKGHKSSLNFLMNFTMNKWIISKIRLRNPKVMNLMPICTQTIASWNAWMVWDRLADKK